MRAANKWAKRNLPQLEEMVVAMEQLRSAAESARDEMFVLGQFNAAAPFIGRAQQRVIDAAARLAAGPRPPNNAMARELRGFLANIDAWRSAEGWDGWVARWDKAGTQWERYVAAQATATKVLE